MCRVGAAHGLDHFLAQLHGRREGLGVSAQHVAEVDVKQVARLRQHQVVQVAIANAQHVCDHAVASCFQKIFDLFVGDKCLRTMDEGARTEKREGMKQSYKTSQRYNTIQ